jgi:lysyl-tRNA synthetase class 2
LTTPREDLRRQREAKLAELAGLGLPYAPHRFGPTRPSEEIKADYEALEGSRVCVAGRLMTVRLMGKAAFATIQDTAGQIQLYFKRDVLGDERYQYFKLLDVGDIVGAEGTVFKTRTGEVSVQVEDLVLLAKSYLPLPDKFHGISDVEVRYRRRYLDLISNENARRIFLVRSRALRAIRHFLDDRGFIEVETPVLQPLYGGAAANPFVTRYAALEMNAYLRIATELYLKRLIVGGIDRVYEIGKDFRNEGFSRKHSPEFTMLELYQAYADYSDIMHLMEQLFVATAQESTGSLQLTFDGHAIDFSGPWRRLSIAAALREFAGVEYTTQSTRDELLALAQQRSVSVDPEATRGKLVEELVSTLVEPNLIQPTFLCDYPVDFPGSLLAKRSKEDPDTVERFELYMGGMEIANGFSELNDPHDQLERMEEATQLRGEEHAEVDSDYILALEHGMPPTGGVGFGIDRLMMILVDAQQIRETILFPLLRPREDTNAES